MVDVVEDFALSYGPADQASGTITLDSQILTLRGVNGTTYQMDFSPGEDNRLGLISVYDVASLRYPLLQGGVGTRTAAGAFQQPTVGVTTSLTALTVVDNVATASYRDTIGIIDVTRTHTIEVIGDAVRIRIQGSGNTSYNSNYSGVWGGNFNSGVDQIELHGTLIFPTAYKTLLGTTRWYGHFLDLSQSNAQGFSLTDPRNPGVDSSYSTLQKYETNDDGVLPADLDETLWCIASSSREDLVVHSNAVSDQITRVANSPRVFITSKADGWAVNQTRVTDLADVWGFDDAVAFPFWWWADPNYDTQSQDNGGNWVPGDETLMAAFGAAMDGVGFKFMPYSYSTLEKPGTDNYDEDNRILNGDGSVRESNFAGVYLCRPEEVAAKFAAQFTALKTDLLITDIFADVDTFVSPYTGGGGNFVNGEAGTSTQTLKTAGHEIRRFLYANKALIGGAQIGEGPRAGYMNDFGIFYEGCVDGLEALWSTNEPREEIDPLYEDGRSPAQWPMDLTDVWKRRNKSSQDVGPHKDRTFTTHEADLQTDPPGPLQLFPHSTAMMDLRRCLFIMHRRPGEIYLAEDWSESMSDAQVIKEFYITTGACRAAAALWETDAVVSYHDDTNGYEDFDTKFNREEGGGSGRGRASFVKTRVRIVIGTLTIWVNRSAVDWDLSTNAGSITLPENGFIVTQGADIYGSFIKDGAQMDVAYKSGQHFLLDGRGTEVSFLGVTTTDLFFDDYSRDFTLTESDGEISRTEYGMTTYATVAEADSYHSDYTESTDWTGATVAEKENALRLATQYLDNEYKLRWKGTRTAPATQTLDWPRSGVYTQDDYLIDSTVFPDALKDACSEMALRVITESAGIMPDVTASDKGLEAKKIKVGPIEVDKSWAGAQSTRKTFTIVNRLLLDLTTGRNLLYRS